MPFHISHIWWITKHINANSFPKINVKNESLFEFLLLLTVCPTFQIRSDAVCDCVRGVCLLFLFGGILENQKVRGPYFGHHHQLASARMIQWNWKLYCPRSYCSHCSQFSVISNYLSCNQLAMVMRKHAEHDGGSWFSFFFIFATINMMDLSSRTWGLILKIQQEPGLQIGIGEALDRSQSNFYFVTQKFLWISMSSGSTRRHQT